MINNCSVNSIKKKFEYLYHLALIMKSQRIQSMICYIACPEYIAETLRDSSQGGSDIATSLRVDTFLLLRDMYHHNAINPNFFLLLLLASNDYENKRIEIKRLLCHIQFNYASLVLSCVINPNYILFILFLIHCWFKSLYVPTGHHGWISVLSNVRSCCQIK